MFFQAEPVALSRCLCFRLPLLPRPAGQVLLTSALAGHAPLGAGAQAELVPLGLGTLIKMRRLFQEAQYPYPTAGGL